MTTSLLERPKITVRLDPDICAPACLEGLCVNGIFTALGESHRLGSPVNWHHNPSSDIEWHIVLHKFFHAPGLIRLWQERGDPVWLELCKTHMESWIETVEPGFIAADVTGRRIRNWVYMLALLDGAERGFQLKVETSLREQALWLIDNLHPGRNHRTLELFAVLIAGVWLSEERWIDFSLAALAENAEADFLPDGVHVELSSHYHCLALKNLIEALELCDDNGIAAPRQLRTIVDRASRFAHSLHKPDGSIPMLSDADTGDYRSILPAPDARSSLEVYRDGGYVFLRDARAVAGDTKGSWLVLDCGDIGVGNHGHLDCLSFEMASQGRSLIVDPGRFSYDEVTKPNWRAAFRQTRAHNLVQVDGLEQTRYTQGPKRMKLRGLAPAATLVTAHDLGPFRYVHASAQSAEFPVRHDRRIIAHDSGWWIVHDQMTADQDHHYDLLFQLDPLAQDRAHIVELAGEQKAVLAPNLLLIPLCAKPAQLHVEQGWVAPQYGKRLAAPRIVNSASAATCWFATLVMPFATEVPAPDFTADAGRISVNDFHFDLGRGVACL